MTYNQFHISLLYYTVYSAVGLNNFHTI